MKNNTKLVAKTVVVHAAEMDLINAVKKGLELYRLEKKRKRKKTRFKMLSPNSEVSKSHQ